MPDGKPAEPQQALTRLLEIMSILRNPEKGCPWDIRQTMASLTRFTIEEAYEVADAIASGDKQAIRDELGDLLFQIVFYAQLGQEEGQFDFYDIANAICDKLVRRHPHVFSDTAIEESDLARLWDAIKEQENRQKGLMKESILDLVPTGLPALMYAQKLQKECAKVGFDWSEVLPVLEKVAEEIDEVKAELTAPKVDSHAVEEEIGDALFAMVNLARHCHVDADTALRNASHKFAARFRLVENYARNNGDELQDLSLCDMEQLWQKAKRQRSAE